MIGKLRARILVVRRHGPRCGSRFGLSVCVEYKFSDYRYMYPSATVLELLRPKPEQH
jgi:hypothetical protein